MHMLLCTAQRARRGKGESITMKKDSRRVPTKQAAAELGMSVQGMREYMKRGLIDIGEVLPAANGGECMRYHVYRDKLDRYMGITQ